MIGRPSLVEYVGKGEVPVGGGGGWQALPGFQLIAGPRKRNHPSDFLMLGKTRRGGRTVGYAREDDLVPSQIRLFFIEKAFPFPLWVFLGQPLDEFQRAGGQTIGLWNQDERTVVFPRGSFQANVSQACSGIMRFLGNGGKPAVGIVRLDQVQSQTAQVFGEFTIVTHQPDNEAVTGRHTGIDDGMLKVLMLALDLGESELELRVFLGQWIDLTRPVGEFPPLSGLRLQGLAKKDSRQKEWPGFSLHCKLDGKQGLLALHRDGIPVGPEPNVAVAHRVAVVLQSELPGLAHRSSHFHIVLNQYSIVQNRVGAFT